MQQQLKILVNYLVLLLVLFSAGKGSVYASGLPEIRQEQPFSSEKIAAANPFSIAYRENSFQEIPELLKKLPYGFTSGIPQAFDGAISASPIILFFSFKRDLRKDLKIQLFPKHFFL